MPLSALIAAELALRLDVRHDSLSLSLLSSPFASVARDSDLWLSASSLALFSLADSVCTIPSCQTILSSIQRRQSGAEIPGIPIRQ